MSGLRRRFDAARRGDGGIAIVVAMAVVMLVGIMLAVVVAIAISEARQTGRDRQRSSGVATAEGQVDVLMAQVQGSSPAALGSTLCGDLTTGADVASDDFGIASTITYYLADGTTEVPCDQIAVTQVAYAKIVSRATSEALANTSSATRVVETLVQLTPSYAIGLDKALFAHSNLTMANNTMLTSTTGKPDADIYTNGNFSCRNNEEFHGSIHAQGSIALESQCTVLVDVWAKGSITVSNPSASIGGRALSSNGSISLDKAALGQQARAAGGVSGQVCSTAGKCFPNQQVDAPPVVNFPQLKWDSAALAKWQAEGYTNIVNLPTTDFPCDWYNGPDLYGRDGKKANLNGKATGTAAWFFANGWKLPADTIVNVNCSGQKMTFQGINIELNKNVVILTRNGLTMSNSTTMKAVSGTATAEDPLLLYLIQPYSHSSWGTSTCSGEGISLDNQVVVDKTVNTLLYSPCSIRKANKSEIIGQIYSGSTLNVDNQLDMNYVPMPVWGGLDATSDVVESYSVDILYKREGL